MLRPKRSVDHELLAGMVARHNSKVDRYELVDRLVRHFRLTEADRKKLYEFIKKLAPA